MCSLTFIFGDVAIGAVDDIGSTIITPFKVFFYSSPLYHSSGILYFLQFAYAKRATTDALYAIWDCDACKATAPSKCRFSNACYAIRDCDIFKACATDKRIIADACHATIIRNCRFFTSQNQYSVFYFNQAILFTMVYIITTNYSNILKIFAITKS